MEEMNKDSQSNKLIVHIGFGKTSTSKLQADVFPLLCEYTGYKFGALSMGTMENQ
jgi:hypothetical protein